MRFKRHSHDQSRDFSGLSLGTRRLALDAPVGKAQQALRLRRSAGELRARELARNACAPHLHNKVEREKGRKLGLVARLGGHAEIGTEKRRP